MEGVRVAVRCDDEEEVEKPVWRKGEPLSTGFQNELPDRGEPSPVKWKKGELQPVFKLAGVVLKHTYEGDPFEFLPKWMSQNPMRSK